MWTWKEERKRKREKSQAPTWGEIRPVLREGGRKRGKARTCPERDSEEADSAGAIGQPRDGANWANQGGLRVS